MEYIKDRKYYIDNYDLKTIKDCLYYAQSLHKEFPKLLKLKEKEKISDKNLKQDFGKMLGMLVVSIKTERFKNKEKTIEDWMEKDRRRQDKYDNTEPLEIYCDDCEILMEPMHKSLWEEKDTLRISFIYNCPKCSKRKAYYDNGEEYKTKPTLCEKCGSEIDIDLKIDDKKDITTWTYKCTGCDYKKVETEDHKKREKDRTAKEKRDRELLDKFRKDFVFTEKEGNECLITFERIKQINEEFEKTKIKEADPAYKKAKSLKKIKVVEVNRILKEALDKEGFIELQFEKPDIGKFVTVPFTTQDKKEDREEYESKKHLKKLIEKALEPSNWRLMSDGISYRAGYLSSRLRCYESEDDQLNMLKTSNFDQYKKGPL